MPDLTTRKCNPKNALREASETSIRNMLSFMCCVLNTWSCVCTDVSTIPPEFRFDASTASDGCIKARRLIAKSYGVPEDCIQFLCPQLYLNLDNIVVHASWLNGGGSEGIPDKGLAALITKQAVLNTSYNCHYQSKMKVGDLNNLKVCFRNTITAGGGILLV